MTEPTLQFAFEIHAQVAMPLDLGVIRGGRRRVVQILGGTFEGSGFKGTLLNGADWQIVHSDGAADLDARYTLKTDDGALLLVNNRGMRRGDSETLARINRGEPADASKIYFRTVATIETSSVQYQWLADSLFIGTGERHPDHVRIRFYRVL
jgi:hypothetical protein